MSAIIFKRLIRIITVVALFVPFNTIYAQPAEQFIKVIVAPDHADWNYATGEKVKFTITVLQNGNAIKNAVVKYETGPEKMEPAKKDSQVLANGTLIVDGGTMKEPGFLRCVATTNANNK